MLSFSNYIKRNFKELYIPESVILNLLRIVTHPFKCENTGSILLTDYLYFNWFKIDSLFYVYLSYTYDNVSIAFISDIDLVKISGDIIKDFNNFKNYLINLENCYEFNFIYGNNSKITIGKSEKSNENTCNQ